MVEEIAQELSSYYGEDVDPLTCREAINNPELVYKMTKGVPVNTISGGAVPLQSSGSQPSELILAVPPILTDTEVKRKKIDRNRIINLAQNALVGGAKLTLESLNSPERADKMVRLIGQTALELVRYPLGNLATLDPISRYDALDAAVEATKADIDATVAIADQDMFDGFNPSKDRIMQALSDAEEDMLTIIPGMKGGHVGPIFYATEWMRIIDKIRSDNDFRGGWYDARIED